jgi:hypothetical protein
MKEILEILQILSKYDADGECDAEHDELFISGEFPPHGIIAEDARRLKELGCSWDESYTSWRKFV